MSEVGAQGDPCTATIFIHCASPPPTNLYFIPPVVPLPPTKYSILHNGISSIHSQAFTVQDGPLASLFAVSCSHKYRHTVGLLCTSDQPVAETSTYTGQHNI
jgi:hypothetical protein